MNSRFLVMAGMATLPLLTLADVPLVDAVGRPASVVCAVTPAGVQVRTVHMDKVIFQIVADLTATVPADQPALDNVPKKTDLDIKILDDPRTVADLEGKVLTFLGAADTANNREGILVKDVEYAVICPRPTQD